jgi:uncharacterized lipoprotein YddW (UPF0748 family)
MLPCQSSVWSESASQSCLEYMPRAARPSVSGLRRSIVAVVAVLTTLIPFRVAGVHADGEVRALWVVRTSLSSPDAIDAMVKAASAGGFNTLLIQVRGRADADYAGWFEPRSTLLAGQPSFDPLAVAIVQNVQAARRLGVGGVILFSYDSLTGPTRGPEYLSEVGRAAFSMQ